MFGQENFGFRVAECRFGAGIEDCDFSFHVESLQILRQRDTDALRIFAIVVNRGDTAIGFDGNNDYAEIPHDDSYLLDNGTVQLWFNTNDTQNGHIFSKDAYQFVTGGHLSIYLNSSEHVVVRLQSDSASYRVESTSSQPITAGGE